MNAITTTQAGGAPATTQPPTRAQKVASAIKMARGLLAVFDDLDAMRAPFRARFTGSSLYPGFLDVKEPNIEQPGDDQGRALMLAVVNRALDGQPQLGDVLELCGRVADALAAGPDYAKTRLLVGLMVDAFPNARPHSPETYIETLISELTASAYTPAVVAKACNMVVRSGTFLPAIGEVLTQAEDARKDLLNTIYLAEGFEAAVIHLGQLREWVETVPFPTRAEGSGWEGREYPPTREHPALRHMRENLRPGAEQRVGWV